MAVSHPGVPGSPAFSNFCSTPHVDFSIARRGRPTKIVRSRSPAHSQRERRLAGKSADCNVSAHPARHPGPTATRGIAGDNSGNEPPSETTHGTPAAPRLRGGITEALVARRHGDHARSARTVEPSGDRRSRAIRRDPNPQRCSERGAFVAVRRGRPDRDERAPSSAGKRSDRSQFLRRSTVPTTKTSADPPRRSQRAKASSTPG